MLNLDKKKKATEDVEVIDLFTLDGKTYSIPAKAKANLGLRYLKSVRESGPDLAAGELLEAMIGTEAYDALMNYDDLEPDDLTQVMEAVQKVVLGGVETPSKN